MSRRQRNDSHYTLELYYLMYPVIFNATVAHMAGAWDVVFVKYALYSAQIPVCKLI